jgi:DNA polymerase III alpha subunit
MAFLTLEDHTGSISLNVFTAQYSACERYLKDGAAVIVTGTVSERETLIKDDAGNPVMETSFNVKSMCFACKEKSTYLMEVSSYAAFHLDQEDDFRKTYEEGNGHKLLIHDYAMDEIREMTYTVSDQTILLSNITEI